MTPRIVIDGRALAGHRTGIGVHTAEIARRLTGNDAGEPRPIIASHVPIDDREGLQSCEWISGGVPSQPGVVWQQLALPRIAARQHADVVWGPHGTLPLMMREPGVATLHDFTSMTMPERHRMKTIVSFNVFIGRSLAQATRIAAVSRATADEAMRWFGIEARRIAIVPNGVDEYFSPSDRDDALLPAAIRGRDYILYVGTIEPRKGISDLVDVWESLPEPRPQLVLCGDRGWKSGSLMRRLATHPQRAQITISGFVTREVMRALYRSAMLFVYPSHYEGFGIPPLEAMACGAPVVATRTGAIPEFGDGAALLVNPGDRNGLAAAIRRLLDGPALRREMRDAGIARAGHYRWDASAATMRALFADAAGRS
jgi:glycosyltransferase involved in cell wall biosynthesis